MAPVVSETTSSRIDRVKMVADALEQVAMSLRCKIQSNAKDKCTATSEEITFSVQDIGGMNRALSDAKALIEAEQASMDNGSASCANSASQRKKIVAVTRCFTGIAHTFLAAESLKKAAGALGHEIKIELQGAAGTKGYLTTEDIADADVVVIAADNRVDTSRFVGKPIYFTDVKQAIQAGKKTITVALAQPAEMAAQKSSRATNEKGGVKAISDTEPNRFYRHLFAGVFHMQPFVIVGGLSIALAFAFGGIYAGEQEGTLAWALNLIGSGIAFQLFVAVLSGFMAFSIADRSGLAPGFIGGMLAQYLGAGFLGGIVSGFLAGYLTKFLGDKIRLPATLEGLKAMLILPLLSSIPVGLAMVYLVAPPVQIIHDVLTGWLRGMQGANAIVLGMLLGGMMAFDMGGPVNKVAASFAISLLTSKVYTPMAAVMVAGMTPPLGIAVAAWLFRNRFDLQERKTAGSTFVLGLSYITEGAIPYAAKDPLRVIPAIVVGAAVSGAISMFCGINLLVPHGGVFTMLIPHAVEKVACLFVALLAGTLVTAALLFVLKKPLGNEQSQILAPQQRSS